MAFVNSAKIINNNLANNFNKVSELKNAFIKNIKDLKDLKINSLSESYSPYILSLSLKGIRSEILIHMLQTEGILISNGASCSSNSKRAGNRVLQAIGLDKELIAGSIRISFNEFNTNQEIQKTNKN